MRKNVTLFFFTQDDVGHFFSGFDVSFGSSGSRVRVRDIWVI